MRNLSSEASQASDVYAVNELRNLLFAANPGGAPPDAIDLIATDIQRVRDIGLSTLNQTRAALGLKEYASFAEVTSDPVVAQHLQQVYGDINKLDLFMGGLAEDHANGAVVGETFQAIIADQFDRLRTGDRFYFENLDLSPQEQQMIEETKFSDILERTTGTSVEAPNVFLTAVRHLSTVTPEEPDAAQLVIGIDADGAEIAGGPKDDTIVAGAGLEQILRGNGGADTFVFTAGGHITTIADFDPSNDRIELPANEDGGKGLFGGTLKLTACEVAGNAVISDGSNTITLLGVGARQLTAASFLAPPGTDVKLALTSDGGGGRWWGHHWGGHS
jgi:hypothetical protein